MPEIFPYNGQPPPNGVLMERQKYDSDNDGICDIARLAYSVVGGAPGFTWEDIIVVNGVVYATAQLAYNAANAAATAGNPVAMLVGQGSFGNITLSAAWNPYVSIVGLSQNASTIGTITAAGFDVIVEIENISMTGIDTSVGASATAGSISVVVSNSTLGLLEVDAGASGTGGNVTLSGNGNASALKLGANGSGAVVIRNVNILGHATEGCIDYCNGSSRFTNCILQAISSNFPAVSNLAGSGQVFTNVILIPNGTGACVDNGTPQTCIMYNCIAKNDLAANVTLTDGNLLVAPSLAIS